MCLPSFANKSWLEWNRIAVLNRAAISLSSFPLSIRISPSDTSLGAEFFFATFQKMNSTMRLYGRTNFRISVLLGFFFFFSPILFLFYFPLSLFLSLDEGGRKETKPWIGEEKLKEGGRKGRGLRGWASIFGSAPENVLACWWKGRIVKKFNERILAGPKIMPRNSSSNNNAGWLLWLCGSTRSEWLNRDQLENPSAGILLFSFFPPFFLFPDVIHEAKSWTRCSLLCKTDSLNRGQKLWRGRKTPYLYLPSAEKNLLRTRVYQLTRKKTLYFYPSYRGQTIPPLQRYQISFTRSCCRFQFRSFRMNTSRG